MVEIPAIDLRLAGASGAEETARLRDACVRLGCFRVSGHGVPPALQAEMKGAVRALFDLPDDAKRRNADIIPGSGYVPPSPANPLYEAFGLCDAATPADVDAFCARLDAPPHVRETVKAYAERMHSLIVDVAGKVAASLGLHGASFQDWPCQFRMNRYNYTQDSVGSPGVQIHTDSGFVTVLQEDECVGGLEVLDPAAGEFVPVDPLPCSFVVNVGDVGQGAVCGGGAAHLDRHVPARAQGRHGERAGGAGGRRAPAAVQGVQVRRLPEAPAVHRRARRRGPRASGGLTWPRSIGALFRRSISSTPEQ